MFISIVVAVSENRVIGREGKLPWHLSDDLKKFKQLTLQHPVIMGRKTFESIGKALPQRTNIIISRKSDFYAENCTVFDSLEKALSFARTIDKEEIFIIGGGEIYAQSMGFVNKIYLTKVKTTIKGDTFFPNMNPDEWQISQIEFYTANEKNNCDFEWLVLEKINEKD